MAKRTKRTNSSWWKASSGTTQPQCSCFSHSCCGSPMQWVAVWKCNRMIHSIAHCWCFPVGWKWMIVAPLFSARQADWFYATCTFSAIYHSLMETEGVNISINGWTTFAYSMSHSSFPERHLSSYLQRDHHHHHHHHYHRHALANSATNGNEDSTTVSASGAPAPWLPTSSEHAHAQSDGGGGNMAQLNGADRSGLPMKKPYSPFRPFHALLMLDNKASTNRTLFSRNWFTGRTEPVRSTRRLSPTLTQSINYALAPSPTHVLTIYH